MNRQVALTVILICTLVGCSGTETAQEPDRQNDSGESARVSDAPSTKPREVPESPQAANDNAIRIDMARDGSLTLNGKPVAVDSLRQELIRIADAISEPKANTTIKLIVDESATYGEFAMMFQQARKAVFMRYELHVGETMIPFEDKHLDHASESFAPPHFLHISAQGDGAIASVSFTHAGPARSYRSIEELAKVPALSQWQGDDHLCNVTADEELEMRHLMRVCEIASQCSKRDGEQVARNVLPARFREIEQLVLENIKPLDVETIDQLAPIINPQLTPLPDTPLDSIEFADDLDAAPLGIGLGKEDVAGSHKTKLAKYGGTQASQAAVARALEWLAKHQLPDGGWSFDHRDGSCGARCTHAGSGDTARNGATALALLPFLAADQTHLEGEYKKVVHGGLDFLVNNMKPDGGGASLHEEVGTMYSHGLGAIALCEAYGMTQDKRLLSPAQASLYFIAYAQDKVGGGWRYAPKTPGDTSVLGWQVAALKAGYSAYLQVPPGTLKGAKKFLDGTQTDDGSTYGYRTPGEGKATTAIGLLSRMQLGWKKDNPALIRGVQFLSEHGPDITKMGGGLYYNYYANQVMFHYGGKEWQKWNPKLRNWLVEQQSTKGHMKGSWHIAGDTGADQGGRLYCTALATLILETYYRHPRLYKDTK